MSIFDMFSNRDEAYDIVNSQYFREMTDAISLYEGLQDQILKRDLAATFEGTKDIFGEYQMVTKHRMSINIIARIVNKLAMVYAEEPAYSSDNDMGEIFKEFTPTLKHADRLSELCGMCWLHPMVQDGKFVLKVIPPHYVVAEYNEYNPDKLEGITLLSFVKDGDQQAVIKTIWRDETYQVLKKDEDITDIVLASYGMAPNPDRVNPYHTIPFIPFYPRRPLDGSTKASYREDLALAQRNLNIRLTDLFYLMHMQSFGQLVLVGLPSESKKNFKVGVGTPIILDDTSPNADAKYINPNAPIETIWKVIQEILHFLAFTNGLSSSWVGSAVPSGAALKVINADIEEYRSDKQEEHRKALNSLACLIEIMATIESIPNVTDENFGIEFGSAEIYIDPIAEIQEMEGLIRNGIVKRVEWVKEHHEELDEPGALQYMDEALTAERNLAKSSMKPMLTPEDFSITKATPAKSGVTPMKSMG